MQLNLLYIKTMANEEKMAFLRLFHQFLYDQVLE